ncbi:DMT family transporter [Fodinibacter luteus]|uniref:DMT family transporter n=1 Tax=Fodinibacter luteus TaxID=552064 RepID=A0ABP8KRJ4_9MICO
MGTLPATAALLAATAVWGSTFVVTKGSLDELDPASFLTWRFGVAAVALLLVRPGSVARLSPADRWRAALLGVALAVGFLLQTTGLQHTLAGVSGFLTEAAVILTPVVAAVFFGDRVGRAGWAAVAVSAVGIAGLAGGVSAPTSVGAALTLAGAACFAVHIAGLSQWATRANAYGLTAVSVATAACLCALAALLGTGIALPETSTAWQSVLYLGVVATCVGFAVQAWAQSALAATTAAVVMTMEPVFAAGLAVALGEQGLGWVGWVGGLLVVAGMALAELGPRVGGLGRGPARRRGHGARRARAPRVLRRPVPPGRVLLSWLSC